MQQPTTVRLGGVSLEEEAAAFDVAPPSRNGTVEVDASQLTSAEPPAVPPPGDAAEDASQIVLLEAGSARDQLSELLADPALLGPVGVLGATIGLPRPEDGPDGGNTESEEEDAPVDFIITASSATAQPQFPQVPAGEVLADSAAPPLPAEDVEDRGPIDWDLVQVEPHAAESREEDLELTATPWRTTTTRMRGAWSPRPPSTSRPAPRLRPRTPGRRLRRSRSIG